MQPLRNRALSEQFHTLLKDYPPLQTLERLCKERDLPVYLVGGAVRDLLHRGQRSKDLDLVVPASWGRRISEEISKELDAKSICLDEQYQIYRVILFPSLETLDIAECIGPDIQADLLRRDLTLNALAYNLATGELLDPAGGGRDLEQGRIRMIREANMLEDPLRLLRVFRVGAELGFTDIDPATLEVVRQHGRALLQAAPERIHYELMRLFSVERSYSYIRLMANTGLLEHIFPELVALRPIPPNQYHHLWLFDHTLELIRQVELHFPTLPQEIQEHLHAQANPFIKRIAVLRLACLLHDTGKPATMKQDPATERTTFYGHEEVSEALTLEAATRLKWGKEITRHVALLVRWHLYPEGMLRPGVTPKAHHRFFRRVGEVMPELILLAIADRHSARGPAVSPQDLEEQKAGLINLFQRYQAFQSEEKSRPKLITGREIMNLLGMRPGPEIGQILFELREAQLGGELVTREDAMEWLKARYGFPQPEPENPKRE